MTGKNKYPTIRLHSHLCDRLSDPYGASANTALERYFWLLNSALPEFSESEWNLLKDACTSWATALESPSHLKLNLLTQVEDAIDLEKLDKKWQVDGARLLASLRSLSPLESIAVLDAIERYWSKPNGSFAESTAPAAKLITPLA